MDSNAPSLFDRSKLRCRGYNPSYTWRSIWGAKPVILDGIGWRVGNGLSIGIKTHSWIPSEDARSLGVPTVIGEVEEDLPVAALIDMDTKTWNVGALTNLFSEVDVRNILAIPLSNRLPGDEVFWRLTANGEYSVKTGYYLCQSSPHLTESNEEKMWRAIWRINAPPKLVHFLWRACSGMLPVKHLLFRRHCSVDDRCPLCRIEEETISHAIFDCTFAKGLWEGCGVPVDWEELVGSSFMDRLTHILSKYAGSELISILATMWAVWSIRNDTVFEEPCTKPYEVRKGFELMVRDYISYKAAVLCLGSASNGSSNTSWKKPETGWVKANVDAALMGDGSVGLGVVLRNEQGVVELVASRRIKAAWSVSIAEARALLFGMEMVATIGKRKVLMEGDALIAINAASNNERNRSHFGLCIDDVKVACALFESVKFVHVKRSGNTVAHFSARLCDEIGVDVLYVNSIPDAILALAELDMI